MSLFENEGEPLDGFLSRRKSRHEKAIGELHGPTGYLTPLVDIDRDGIPNQYDTGIDYDGFGNWMDRDADGDGLDDAFDPDWF